MAAPYHLFIVDTAKSKPGKGAEAAKWWEEKGKAYFASLPGIKSVKAYAVQFSLGGEYSLEFWTEIEDYSVLDKWDADILKNPAKHGPMFKEYTELFESGPARLLGDWPESRLGIEEG